QKAKVKWDIEGDENTAFFHGLLKQRRRLKMVYGIMHDGEWCTDPELYKIIAKLLALRLAKVVGSLVSSEQSAFVKERQILDNPLMVSEVMEWYKLKRKKLLIFKVDFEKAYDSLCWEYLDYMMEQFEFGHNSRSWILECIVSARMSVLVNGSPTNEIALHRGLRQGFRCLLSCLLLQLKGYI
ncbi:RNA-directed DNA polymerase, eukaryota, partial [Tanacetum coccineum]